MLAILGTGLWVLAYVYINALACAFVTNVPAGGCGFEWPWQLRGEDLTILVLIPGVILSSLCGGAFLLGRRR